jgi:hypothetical protein
METNVTDEAPADLVDVFYTELVKPLGNLVILCAQAEAALLELWIDLSGCTEDKAQKFFLEEQAKVERQIAARAQTALPDHVQELSDQIKSYYCDRKQRHRLIHDEWYVSLLDGIARPRTRGLPRKSNNVAWGDPEAGEIWELARRFRDYRSLFLSLSRVLHDQKSGALPFSR